MLCLLKAVTKHSSPLIVGASLFWENATQPLPHQEAPPTSSPTLSPSHSPSSSIRPSSCIDPPVTSATGRVEDAGITSQEGVSSPSNEHR